MLINTSVESWCVFFGGNNHKAWHIRSISNQGAHPRFIYFDILKVFEFRCAKDSSSQTHTSWKMSVFGVYLVFIQSECRQVPTRKTPNTNTIHAVSRRWLFRILSNIYNGNFRENSQRFRKNLHFGSFTKC